MLMMMTMVVMMMMMVVVVVMMMMVIMMMMMMVINIKMLTKCVIDTCNNTNGTSGIIRHTSLAIQLHSPIQWP